MNLVRSRLRSPLAELSANRSYPETGFEEVGRIGTDKSALWDVILFD